MASERKFYRTVITVEILTDAPYDPDSIKDVAYDVTDGDVHGHWEVSEQQELDGPKVAKLLIKQGSDPAWLSLDSEGNDIDQ